MPILFYLAKIGFDDNAFLYVVQNGGDLENVYYRKMNVLSYLLLKGCRSLFCKLITDFHINVNTKCENGMTPIFFVSNFSIDILQTMIEHGVDLRVESSDDGIAPLDYLCKRGQTDIVRILLKDYKDKFDINHRDKHMFTPLLHAMSNGHTEIVTMLIEHGASVFLKTKQKTSLLHFAARYDSNIVKILIEKGIPVNIKNRRRRTPLMFAFQFNSSSSVDLILQNGADPSLKSRFGFTANDYHRKVHMVSVV